MTHLRFCSMLIGLAGLAMVATLGCARWIDVIPSPANERESATLSIPHDERVPLIVDSLSLLQNGAPQNPSAELERRILNTVRDTRLFSTLAPLGSPASSLGNKVVTARIAFDETIDPHAGEAA